MFATTMVLWPLLTSRHSLLLRISYAFVDVILSADETSPGKNAIFRSIYLPHLPYMIPCSYWASACLAVLPSCIAWCDFCSSDQRFAHGLVCSPYPASFRFHLTMDTLALGYTLLTTRACCGLSPIRLRPYWAHQIKHKKNFSCAFKNNDFFQTSTYNSQIHHRANGSKLKRLQLSQMVKYHFYKKDR